jgi:hypothetical protein
MRHSTRDNLALLLRVVTNSGLLCFIMSVGCAGQTPAPAAAGEPRVRIGRACPMVSSGDAPSLVLVELADTRLTAPSDDLKHKLEAPLAVRGVGRLLASLGEAASMPWGGCTSEPCESRVNTLTITPELAESAAKTVRLSVELATAGSAEPPRTKVLETRNQEPVLLRFDDRTPTSPVAWVVTPYLMSSREGVRQAMECQVEGAARE